MIANKSAFLVDFHSAHLKEECRFDVWESIYHRYRFELRGGERNAFDSSFTLLTLADRETRFIKSQSVTKDKGYLYIERDNSAIARYPWDQIVVKVSDSNMIMGADARSEFVIPAGSISFLSLSRRGSYYYPEGNKQEFSFILEAQDLLSHGINVDNIHGFVIRAADPRARLIRFWAGNSWASIAKFMFSSADRLAESTGALVAACLLAPDKRDAKQVEILEVAKRLFIESYIEANLRDGRLSANGIAANCGLSRRSLFRLMEVHGGVEKYLLARRLSLAASELQRADTDTSNLEHFAHKIGFANRSHFSTAFKRWSSLSPKHYREQFVGSQVSTKSKEISGSNLRVAQRFFESFEGSLVRDGIPVRRDVSYVRY